MNILVTGGAGFIGSNFIRFWLTKYPEDNIVNIDKLTYAGNLSSLKDIENNPNYKFIKGDICDSDLINDITKDIELIVHFAAESHVDRGIITPIIAANTNIIGTLNLLEAAKTKNIRFHHISTDEVFGTLDLDSKEKFNENTKYDPRQPYSAAKASSDMLVRSYFHTYNTQITISNCSNNYGPYQHPEKLIPKAITRILTGGKIPMMKTSKAVRDWLYVEDHCKAIDLIINKGRIGETYCIGGNNEISLLQIITTICDEMNVSFDDVVEIIADRHSHDLRYAIDYSKIEKELGWRPETNFEKGLVKTIDWYKTNKKWWRPLLKDVTY